MMSFEATSSSSSSDAANTSGIGGVLDSTGQQRRDSSTAMLSDDQGSGTEGEEAAGYDAQNSSSGGGGSGGTVIRSEDGVMMYVAASCTTCRVAHRACDGQRPCKRCVRLGCGDDCRDPEPKRRGRPPKKDDPFALQSDGASHNTQPAAKQAAKPKKRPSNSNIATLPPTKHESIDSPFSQLNNPALWSYPAPATAALSSSSSSPSPSPSSSSFSHVASAANVAASTSYAALTPLSLPTPPPFMLPLDTLADESLRRQRVGSASSFDPSSTAPGAGIFATSHPDDAAAAAAAAAGMAAPSPGFMGTAAAPHFGSTHILEPPQSITILTNPMPFYGVPHYPHLPYQPQPQQQHHHHGQPQQQHQHQQQQQQQQQQHQQQQQQPFSFSQHQSAAQPRASIRRTSGEANLDHGAAGDGLASPIMQGKKRRSSLDLLASVAFPSSPPSSSSSSYASFTQPLQSTQSDVPLITAAIAAAAAAAAAASAAATVPTMPEPSSTPAFAPRPRTSISTIDEDEDDASSTTTNESSKATGGAGSATIVAQVSANHRRDSDTFSQLEDSSSEPVVDASSPSSSEFSKGGGLVRPLELATLSGGSKDLSALLNSPSAIMSFLANAGMNGTAFSFTDMGSSLYGNGGYNWLNNDALIDVSHLFNNNSSNSNSNSSSGSSSSNTSNAGNPVKLPSGGSHEQPLASPDPDLPIFGTLTSSTSSLPTVDYSELTNADIMVWHSESKAESEVLIAQDNWKSRLFPLAKSLMEIAVKTRELNGMVMKNMAGVIPQTKAQIEARRPQGAIMNELRSLTHQGALTFHEVSKILFRRSLLTNFTPLEPKLTPEAANSLKCPYFEWGTNAIILYANDELCRLTGYTMQELVTEVRYAYNLLADEDKDSCMFMHVGAVLCGATHYQASFIGVHRQKFRIPFRMCTSLVRGAGNGDYRYTVAYCFPF